VTSVKGIGDLADAESTCEHSRNPVCTNSYCSSPVELISMRHRFSSAVYFLSDKKSLVFRNLPNLSSSKFLTITVAPVHISGFHGGKDDDDDDDDDLDFGAA
jgi:hypothetical protein